MQKQLNFIIFRQIYEILYAQFIQFLRLYEYTFIRVIKMRKILIYIAIMAVVTVAVPFFVISVKGGGEKTEQKEENIKTISVYIKDKDKVENMEFEEYITNVVCAEMPALFEAEALKAQAVAARTYTVSKINANVSDEILQMHKNARICTDSAHCQAYLSNEELQQKWGNDADKYYSKIKSAVYNTQSEIVTYNNEPIRAVFHSSNNGKTENAKNVWGGEFPYLVSVESAGEDLSPKYKTEYTTTFDNFYNVISQNYANADKSRFIENITYTDGEKVDSITVFGTKIRGVDMRSMFKLNSADFEIQKQNDVVTFTCYGYGHGVGMSQYGANYMAKNGKKYDEILKTYYSGTAISMYNLK